MMDTPAEVFTGVDGEIGRITRQRPELLNTQSHDMARLMTEALRQWANNPQVKFVLIDAVGSRGFCAGGDIVFDLEGEN